MKKFKHKKTGLEATQIDNIHYEIKYWKSKIPSPIIEDSEDWEEVIEKNYEILSFRNKYGEIFNLSQEGYYKSIYITLKDESWRTLDYTLNKATLCTIHSIKRLSDEEVFTVGDQVNMGIISKFEIGGNTLVVNFENQALYVETIKHLKHEKKPLFVTEDGIKVFYDDKYWFVDCDCDCFGVTANKRSGSNVDNKRFSTKEAAQQYIDLNKPKYSLKDVGQAFYNHGIEFLKYDILRELKNLNK